MSYFSVLLMKCVLSILPVLRGGFISKKNMSVYGYVLLSPISHVESLRSVFRLMDREMLSSITIFLQDMK